jgi:hypothetical protein
MVTGNPPHEDSTLKTELALTEHLPNRLKVYRETMQRAKPLTAHRKVVGMDSRLAAILERCLAVDPGQRFRSAGAVVAALDRRQRTRRQQAILYAGLLVPVALLIMLGTLGFVEAQGALAKAKDSLIKQAKDSYTVSARYAADRIKGKINKYLEKLVANASDGELVKTLTDSNTEENKERIQEKLESFIRRDSPKAQIDQGPVKLYSLFYANGRLVGTFPLLKLSQKNFAWRGYFNGASDQWQVAGQDPPLDADGQSFDPVSEPHVSHPYRSTDREKRLFVGLSAPVKVRGHGGQTVGVLLANLDLELLNQWLTDVDIDRGFGVLLDDDYHILWHPNRSDKWLPKDGEKTSTFGDCEIYKKIFSPIGRPYGADVYKDPIDDKEYVAGFVRINFGGAVKRKWGLLVQVEHAAVIEPAEALKHELVHWSAMILTVALLLITALWLGLIWHLRREDKLAHC